MIEFTTSLSSFRTTCVNAEGSCSFNICLKRKKWLTVTAQKKLGTTSGCVYKTPRHAKVGRLRFFRLSCRNVLTLTLILRELLSTVVRSRCRNQPWRYSALPQSFLSSCKGDVAIQSMAMIGFFAFS